MTIIDMRPTGWDEMTPRKWGTIRNMIRLGLDCAIRAGDTLLSLQAQTFLIDTEGFDV